MWYDVFSLFYDRALEGLYLEARREAVRALRPADGGCVLDLACGTGQNFDVVVPRLGAGGGLVGVDRSGGMLRAARRRVRRAGWSNVALERCEATAVDAALVRRTFGRPAVDAVLCTLGLTAIADWERAFAASFDVLRPGGRYVVLDVHAEDRIAQTRSVELVARADLSRRVWEPLKAASDDFERTLLDADPKTFGGRLFVASGTKR